MANPIRPAIFEGKMLLLEGQRPLRRILGIRMKLKIPVHSDDCTPSAVYSGRTQHRVCRTRHVLPKFINLSMLRRVDSFIFSTFFIIKPHVLSPWI